MFDIYVYDVKCVQINLLTYLSHTVAYEELLNDHKLEGKTIIDTGGSSYNSENKSFVVFNSQNIYGAVSAEKDKKHDH